MLLYRLCFPNNNGDFQTLLRPNKLSLRLQCTINKPCLPIMNVIILILVVVIYLIKYGTFAMILLGWVHMDARIYSFEYRSDGTDKSFLV